jgi:hypothetical protein
MKTNYTLFPMEQVTIQFIGKSGICALNHLEFQEVMKPVH